ncbi:Itc1 protein [Maudiozyma humilis]|uniref:Itc1 protein n=1 Tax=Maudiozyma humilis TaxID=51915 RepID=A0AAV5RTJ0_MAUHU|nr:Itc1 protein [Kazachstania humilis]
MVLYKRKPIVLPDPLPLPMDLNVYVWHIDETGEWFPTYEGYLERLDFYMKHHFTCEITGTSCLTFFQALDSEETQFKFVEEKFPLKLREPVARFLHFNPIKRLDALVEHVYTKFKCDYFPGEVVYLRKTKDFTTIPSSSSGATAPGGAPVPGSAAATDSRSSSAAGNGSGSDAANHPQFQKPYIIKEKSQFNATYDPNTGDVLAPPVCKYMLIEDESQMGNGRFQPVSSREANAKSFIVDQSAIYRDRSTFTKHLIKCFFKISLHRASSKMGAPWCVKPEYLSMYGLKMDWPIDMLKYKDDEPQIEDTPAPEDSEMDGGDESNKGKQRGRKRKGTDSLENGRVGSDSNGGDYENLSSEAGDNNDGTTGKTNKKRKGNAKGIEDDNTTSRHEPSVEPVINVITSIMDDLELPYQNKKANFIGNFQYYNRNLETVTVKDRASLPHDTFDNFGKLIQTYQFLNTFNERLLLSNFNLDQFITSLKCTDGFELKGEIVDVQLKNVAAQEVEDDEDIELSEWQRNAKIRKMISQKEENPGNAVSYRIEKSEPADDDIIDNVNTNGTAIIVECFISLLPLFINEKGEWLTIVTEEWLDIPERNNDETVKQDPVVKGEGSDETNNNVNKAEEIQIDDSDEEEDADEAEEQRIEKCLNFRGSHWSEKLAKRQFTNHYWLIIVVGILQDSLTVPKYEAIIKPLVSKLLPEGISTPQLPKQLWRNFCNELTFSEKVTTLWLLVDMVSNFSPEIKQSVDDSLELSNQIRSERFRINREIKALLGNASKATQENNAQQVQEFQSQADILQNDKNFLDKRLVETDLQRLKSLGSDRYGNKYFWFSLTGMPVITYNKEQLESGSTVLEYMTGRLFIQGPAKMLAKYLLKITDKEIDDWTRISKSENKMKATKDVFHIYRHQDGSYRYMDPNNKDTEIILTGPDGNILPGVELLPIQRKIIDESPENLIMGDDSWYSVSSSNDVAALINWLDTWGRREHDLLRQFRNTALDIENAIMTRDRIINNPEYMKEENNILEQLCDNSLTIAETTLDSNGHLVKEAEATDKDEKDSDDDATLNTIDSKLEEIADKIIALEDASKTRKTLTDIAELVSERDELLEQKEKIVNSQRPGARIMARSEKKRSKLSRDNKITNQAELLTDLLNFRHFKTMEDVIAWKNNRAISSFGCELRKSTSTKKSRVMSDLVPSVDERIDEIMKHLSGYKNNKEQ